MSGSIKVIALVLVVGLACFCLGSKVPAMEPESSPGGVPLYYLQLQDFAAEMIVEDGKPRLLEYTVETGDCLYTIAERFGTDVHTLIRLNSIVNPGLIYPGDRLEILTVIGCVHDVTEGDTVEAIADAYGVDENAIREANELEDIPELPRGERIIVPGGVAARNAQRLSFQWPLQGRLSSGYGWRSGKFHYGIDLAVPYGTAFCASAAGRVTHAGYRGSYGIMVEVDHGGGYLTRYGHASRAAVAVGHHVKPGEILGYVGLTGNTTGPHLHFELHVAGEKVNPLKYLP